MTENPLSVVQFTDTHIYADPDKRLGGMDTRLSLKRIKEHFLACEARADAVLVTGDLTAASERAAYQWLAEELTTLAKPTFAIPGNHDDAQMMRSILPNYGWQVDGHVDFEHWQFILLDTAILGEAYGLLDEAELVRLQDLLSAKPELHTLVCLHHHPVPIRSAWMDTMQLQNAAGFWSIIDRYPQVRAVLWGHVHQNFDAYRRATRLLATPSTCVQFAARSDRFAMDRLNPGYRRIELFPDGRINTTVQRLANDQCIDLSA